MNIEYFRTLFDFTSWANGQVFDAAARVDAAALAAPMAGGYGSAGDTLIHLVSAQQTWLARVRGQTPPPDLAAPDFATVAAVRTRWEATDREMRELLAALDDAALARPVSYVNAQGELNEYALWHVLLHLNLHAAQHRAELAMILTQFGASPGWLDFPYYLDLRDGTTSHLTSPAPDATPGA